MANIIGTAGADQLTGTDGDDVIDGGAGNDVLTGGLGSDTYIFGYGYGRDRIYNQEPLDNQSIDRIRFLPGVPPHDVMLRIVTRDSLGNPIPATLVVQFRSTGEIISVYGSHDPSTPGSAIDFIEFADGTVWDAAEIERRIGLIEGTAGDDFLFGSTGDDVIDGGAGNDILQGNAGNDTYVFGHGYGHDKIYDYETEFNNSVNRIRLNADVSPQDVVLSVVTQDSNGGAILPSLLLTLRNTGETLLVNAHFETTINSDIEFIEFANGTVWDKLQIRQLANSSVPTVDIEGTPWDDVLYGTPGNDVINGGAGNDIMVGDAGSDTYIFGQGYGHDQIFNYEPQQDQSVDRIRLNPEVTPQDVALSVVRQEVAGYGLTSSLQLTLRSTGETLLVFGHFDSGMSGAAIDLIEFADGTVWDQELIRQLANYSEPATVITGTPGNDVLTGTAGDDIIDGGAGNDTLTGGLGSDTYVFGYGYGRDRIYNQEPADNQSVDRIRLNPGVTPQDVRLRVVTNDSLGNVIPATLLLTLYSTGEIISVYGSHDPGTPGSAIDFIEFADGTVWDQAEIERRIGLIEGNPWNDVLIGTASNEVLLGGDGDDLLDGSWGDDVLDGGAGNDTLVGGLGSDTYLFGIGSGHDTILNTEPANAQSPDRILLKRGLTPVDVQLSLVNQDFNGNVIPTSLQLRLKPTGETLTVVLDSLDPNVNGMAIDFIEFADGTVWDYTEIERRSHLIEGTAGDDTLLGTAGNDIINGGAGNDNLDGGAGDDVLDGGAGNDVLTGGLGSDTYIFGYGYGRDRIYNQEPLDNLSIDRIRLAPGVPPQDVLLRVVTRDSAGNAIPATLLVQLRSTGEIMSVYGSHDPSTPGSAIDFIEFADGTVWDQTEIERRIGLIEGTPGNDVLVGTAGNEVLLGGVGNDILDGGAGDDVLDPGPGDDYLTGGLGSDTYIFGYGYGRNRIYNQEPLDNPSIDRIRLNPGVPPQDVELKIITADSLGNPMPASLLLRLRSTGDLMSVYGSHDPGFPGSAIDFIEFADGTVWDVAEIERRLHLFEGTPGDDVLTGTSGNDVINGGAGNDTLDGGAGDDVLDGGAGNDVLIGGLGSDTYVFGQGYGHDVIHNVEDLGNPAVDRIRLNAGVSPQGVVLREVTQDGSGNAISRSLQLTLSGAGETLLVFGNYEVDGNGTHPAAMDFIEFADGTVWDQAEIYRRAHLIEGTAGNDVLFGTQGNDTIDGGAGKDTMAGGLGDDTYIVDRAGDVIVEAFGEGIDHVKSSVSYTLGANLENLTLTGTRAINGTGNDRSNILVGNSADNTLRGGTGNDTLDGGAGNDLLVGGKGNDTYLFGRGYGHDTIRENDNTPGNTDVLQFLSGVSADQLWFRRVDTHDLEVSIIGTGDKATVQDWYRSTKYHVEEFKTADGKTLQDSQVQNLVQAMACFAPPAAGQTTLSPSYAAALQPVIAANWQ